jgi:hypothetical protein
VVWERAPAHCPPLSLSYPLPRHNNMWSPPTHKDAADHHHKVKLAPAVLEVAPEADGAPLEEHLNLRGKRKRVIGFGADG